MGETSWRVRLGAVLLGLVVVVLGAGTEPASGRRTQAVPVSPDGVPRCGVERPVDGAPPASRDDGLLRVATFNILHSDTTEGDESLGARLPLAASAIAASGADVVGLQEVTRNTNFDAAAEFPQKHGLVAQRMAAAVADRTGETWQWCWSQSNPHFPFTPDLAVGGGNPLDELMAMFGNAPEPGDFREGVAILTRFELTGTRFRHLLPRSYEAVACASPDPLCPLAAAFDSRQLLWARVSSPHGDFDLFTTHLAHGLTPLSDFTKLFQMQQVLDLVAQWATPDSLPDFLVGDFNSGPAGDVLRTAADAGFVDTYAASGGAPCAAVGDAACSGGPTDGQEVYGPGPTRRFSERIDYVLARPPARCTLAVPASEVIGDEAAPLPDGRWLWPSDHLGFASAVACAATDSSAAGVPPPPATASGGRGSLPATGGARGAAVPAALAVAGVVVARFGRRRVAA